MDVVAVSLKLFQSAFTLSSAIYVQDTNGWVFDAASFRSDDTGNGIADHRFDSFSSGSTGGVCDEHLFAFTRGNNTTNSGNADWEWVVHGNAAIDGTCIQHFFHFLVHFVFIRNLNGSKFFVFSSADEGNINTSVSSQYGSFHRVCFAMFASKTGYSDLWSCSEGASFQTGCNVHESFGNHFFNLCHNDLLIPFSLQI